MTELGIGADIVRLPAQFGVRFYDPVTDGIIADGLQVRLWPTGYPERWCDAIQNRNNFFIAQPLNSFYSGPATHWQVQVNDTRRRFLPIQFDAIIPQAAPQSLLLFSPVNPISPFFERTELPLFSAPTRSIPSGVGVVQADLRDPAGQPVAWAIVLVYAVGSGGPNTLLGVGMADKQGSLLLAFRFSGRTRIGSATSPDYSEIIRLFAYSAPETAAARIPDLAMLMLQPEALLAGHASPYEPLADLEVITGKPYRLQTAGLAYLLVRPIE